MGLRVLETTQSAQCRKWVPSADQGGDDNVEAAGGEGPDLVLLTIQGVLTTSGTSATQAQAPPSIVVINIIGNVTKGE